MVTFQELKKAAKHISADAPSVRMALAGDTATGLLATGLRGAAAQHGLRLELYETPYGLARRELLGETGSLREWDAQYVVVYCSTRHFAEKYAACSIEEQCHMADDELVFFETLANDAYFASRTIVAFNLPMVDDGVYGTLASSVKNSLPSQIRAFNFGLQRLAQAHSNFVVCDIDAIQATLGRDHFTDDAVYTATEIDISPAALPVVCERVISVVTVRRGILRKVLVTDLDDTLWGGVVSEDGVQGLQIGHSLGIGRAFSEIQRWIKKLLARGIILCVVSKNDEPIARLPFREHPDMLLCEDDVAVFLANWETKADNILHLAEILHIGTDQMVFLDDNPFERNLVRRGIPDICVPELPDDPARRTAFLAGLHLFDTASVSAADAQRGEQYRREASRVAFRKVFKDEEEYLASLEMQASVEGLTPFNLPRAAQLTQRSNQFNLRTRRYTEAELQAECAGNDAIALCFTLSDRFGSHGLVGVAILQRTDANTYFLDTFLMSCRVLKRSMETFMMNTVVEQARSLGATRITAEYIPTPKNAMVANLLPKAGFCPAPICCRSPYGAVATTTRAVPYVLEIKNYIAPHCHISCRN